MGLQAWHPQQVCEEVPHPWYAGDLEPSAPSYIHSVGDCAETSVVKRTRDFFDLKVQTRYTGCQPDSGTRPYLENPNGPLK
eukprot:731161-Amphidinium_carterae.1